MAHKRTTSGHKQPCFEYIPLGWKDKIYLTTELFRETLEPHERHLVDTRPTVFETYCRFLKRNLLQPFSDHVFLTRGDVRGTTQFSFGLTFNAFYHRAQTFDIKLSIGWGLSCRAKNGGIVLRKEFQANKDEHGEAGSANVHFAHEPKQVSYVVDRKDFEVAHSPWQRIGNELLSSRTFEIAVGAHAPGYLGQLALESERYAADFRLSNSLNKEAYSFLRIPEYVLQDEWPSPYGTISVSNELMECYSQFRRVSHVKYLHPFFRHGIALDKCERNIDVLRHWRQVEDAEDKGELTKEEVTKLAVIAWAVRQSICRDLVK